MGFWDEFDTDVSKAGQAPPPAAKPADDFWKDIPEPEGFHISGDTGAAAPSHSLLGWAVEPITSYPETYQEMNKEAQSQIGRGISQLSSGEGAWEKAKGIGNVGLGTANYVASPINAALRSVVGRPIERATGIPKEYSEFAASLALPTPKKLPTVLPPARTAPLTKLEELTQAGQRVGVDIPRAAGAEGTLAQRTVATVKEVPLAGDPLVDASQKAIKQMDEAAQRTATTLGNPSVIGAGDAVKNGLKEWITGPASTVPTGSRSIIDRLYDPIGNAVNPNARLFALQTEKEMNKMIAERSAFTSPGKMGPAIDLVKPAASNINGLTFKEMNDLRKQIGARLDGSIVPEAGTSQPDLKRLYGAIKEDIKNLLLMEGGHPLVDKFDRATRISQQVIARRNNLAKIIGVEADARPELVFGRIRNMMNGGTKGDLNSLLQVRKSIGSDAWNDVASTVVSRLGRNERGDFSGQKFANEYNSIPDRSKTLMFGSMKRDLDDLARVGGFEKEISRFASTSKSGTLGATMAEMAAIWTAPYVALPGILGARVFSHWLASPVRVNQMAGWSRAQALAATHPTVVNMKRFIVATEALNAKAKADQQIQGMQ